MATSSTSTSSDQGISGLVSSDDPEEVFTIIHVIGRGSYGVVCTCEHVATKEIYAVKFIEMNQDGPDSQNSSQMKQQQTSLRKEIVLLQELKGNPYCVQYYGCYMKESTLLIVMEFCAGGAVLDLITICHKTLTEEIIAAIVAQVVQGLIYLHSQKLVHRDIKAGNILLTADGKPKLADFGVSTKLQTTIARANTCVGSPYWMAPEIIKGIPYTFQADVWSLGITCIEMAEGQPPNFDVSPFRVIFLIPARPPPTLSDTSKWSPAFNNFIARCLVSEPDDRPSAEALLNEPFVKRGLSVPISVLKDLVQECLPALNTHRSKQSQTYEKTEKMGSMGGTKPGTMLGLDKNTGTFSSKGKKSTGTSTSTSTTDTDGEGCGTVIFTSAAGNQ